MSLYKRPGSKYWWMKFTFDGELVQRSTMVANKRDALTVESAYRTQLALGKIGIKPRAKAPMMKTAIAGFLAYSKLEHLAKPNSFRRIEYSCQSLIKFFGSAAADKIEPSDVEKFVAWRSKQISKKTGKPISRDVINLELIALKSIFKRLIASDVLTVSPARSVKQLAANERSFHVLSFDDERRYLLACKQPLRDVAALILATGMRPSEVYSLKRTDVNMTGKCLQIENSKTAGSNRRIYLNDDAARVLQHRLDKFSGVYLFPQNEKDGSKPTYQLNSQHQATLKRIGLKFRLYDCRHSFATRVLESGVDLLTLAHLLGHSSLDEVMRYAHPSDSRKSEAIQMMQKVV